MIRSQIEWFDNMHKMVLMCSESINAPVTDLPNLLKNKRDFVRWAKKRCDLEKEDLVLLHAELKKHFCPDPGKGIRN